MKLIKTTLFLLGGIALLIQFFRPARNASEGISPHDITTKYSVPPDVQAVLRTSCYDCHSDNTRYPWYAEVQPVGWFLNDDIQKGKKELNFSEFGTYPARRQLAKLNGIIDQLTEEKMPLPAYLLIHTEARLSQEQRNRVIAWAQTTEDSLKERYPADSLRRRR